MFTLFMILFNMSFAAHRLATNSKYVPKDLATLICLPLVGFNLWTVLTTQGRVRRVYHVCSKALSPDQKKLIRRRDFQFVFFVAGMNFFFLSYMTYYTTRFGFQQAMALGFGYTIPEEAKYDPALYSMITVISLLCPYMFFYLFSATWMCITYYTMAQYVLKEVARGCLQFIENIRQPEFDNILKSSNPQVRKCFREILVRFKFYNDLVVDVNDTLGVISFITLADDFVSIMCCVSFVAIYKSDFTLPFMISTVGFAVILKLTLLYFSIKVACDAYDLMKKARKETVEMLSGTRFEMRDESWSNLSLYLSKVPISKATVWNLFKMRRTILLSFAESVIPFTVMIITTCIEFKSGRNRV